MTIVYEYRTNKLLAEVSAKEFGAWCEANGYLPHHKVKGGWVVVA